MLINYSCDICSASRTNTRFSIFFHNHFINISVFFL